MRRALKREDGAIEVVALLLNGSATPLQFRLPSPSLPWRLLIDTADPEAEPRDLEGDEMTVADHAAVVVSAVVESTER